MSNTSEFAINSANHSMDQMLRREERTVLEHLDAFTANRHNEKMSVAASLMREHVLRHRALSDRFRPIGLSEIVNLDSSVVTEDLFPDLDPDSRERVGSMIKDLIDHARRYLAETREPAPRETRLSTEKIAKIIRKSFRNGHRSRRIFKWVDFDRTTRRSSLQTTE